MDLSGKQSSIDGADDNDEHLSKSEFLTREEVLNRRLRRVRKLANVYRDYYWALMEDLRYKHRDYYWKYGKSPLNEESEDGIKGNNQSEKCAEAVVNSVDNGNNCENFNSTSGNLGIGDSFNWCVFPRCNKKAMALTKYCVLHILADKEQQLYKGCNFVQARVQGKAICCNKPLLRSIIPSLCSDHLAKTEKQLSLALKKAGLNAYSSTKFARKFHVLVAEYVHQIQSRRKAALNVNTENMTGVKKLKIERPD